MSTSRSRSSSIRSNTRPRPPLRGLDCLTARRSSHILAGVCISVQLALLPTGCGGGSGRIYDPATVKDCFARAGRVDTENVDYIAMDADGFDALIGNNTATISFGRTANDAKRVRSAYEIFSKAFDAPTDDVLFVRGNAVISWENTPTESEKHQLDACLS